MMFYNGATHDAWRIGWVTFDQGCECITGRGVELLLVPPAGTDWAATDIAFAGSAVLQEDGLIHLYYSLEDRLISRASCALMISRPAGPAAARRYGFTVFQPPGNFLRAASSLTDGGMMKSSPGFQLTGVATDASR